MSDQTRSRASKPKPKPKPKAAAKRTTPSARKRKPASPIVPVRTRSPEPHPPEAVPAIAHVAPPVTHRSNSMAIAAIACAAANFTFVPMLGGFVAAGIGAVAVDRERREPERYTGRGFALAAVYIGLLTAVLPMAFVTLFTSTRITPIPFIAVSAYAAWVIKTGLRGKSRGHKLAILGGSLGLTLISVALAIGLGFAFYFLMRHISIEIGSAIGDAFTQMFDGIGDAFGSCGDAIDF